MSTVWRYRAIPAGTADGAACRSGEISGESAADARAALRRVGLVPIDLAPLQGARPAPGAGSGWVIDPLRDAWRGHLRRRRVHAKAEVYDGLATLLESGVPLMDALGTVAGTQAQRSTDDARRAWAGVGSRRAMLLCVREALRSGSPLGRAMREHAGPGWFDTAEIAMVNAAQHSGRLPAVLRTLADRQERSGELSGRLAAALTYPAIVALVGLGVVVFLSSKTLPEITGVLAASRVSVPALTTAVMAFGRSVTGAWPILVPSILAVPVVFLAARELCRRRWPALDERFGAISPRVLRRLAVARVAGGLSELTRTGVPIVEALRVLAPTIPSAPVRRRLLAAADAVEHGAALAASLAAGGDRWFDAEFIRVVEVGESGGDLPDLLERLGCRYERSSRRLIDRLSALLEPAAIVLLAVLVGLVVMSAVLPLVRLRHAV